MGLPDSVNTVWPDTLVQTCIVHLMRNRPATPSRAEGDADSQGPQARLTWRQRSEVAEDRFLDFQDEWGQGAPQQLRELWENAWASVSLPSSNLTGRSQGSCAPPTPPVSVNARIRKAVKARGHFAGEQAALKCVYMAVMALDPTGKGRARWTQRCKERPQRLRHHLQRAPVRPLH